ncbi:MAG TPA: ABC transporter permease [Bacteroidota bacterium]|nr:ABC transporter permease [Bacteroidota bacterium]
MNHFSVVVWKELRDIMGTTRFMVSFAVAVVLILLAFVAGAGNYRSSMARYEAAKQQELRKLDGVTDWLAVRDHRIFLPPEPLASLVPGVSNDIGRTVDIHGRGEVVGTESRYGEEPALAAFRTLDLDFILQIVLSLLGILFAYDAVNGEKESGTLRLTFSSSLPRTPFIAAKIIGRYLAVGIPVLLALLAGWALLPAFGIVLTMQDWLRYALIVAAALLYCGVFVVLAVAVSSLSHRSSTSFLTLLVIWVTAVLIIPRLAVAFAGHAVDVLSVDDIAAQKTRLNMQLFAEDRERTAEFKPTSSTTPDSMMKEFQSFMGSLADARDKKLQDLSDRLNEERNNGLARQRSIALALARVSPAALFSLAVTSLAGTSQDLEGHFLQSASAYQRAYGNFMMEKTGMNPGGAMIIMRRSTDDTKPQPINPYELPVFEYRRESLAQCMQEAGLDLGILLALTGLLFFLAFRRFLRYDVR